MSETSRAKRFTVSLYGEHLDAVIEKAKKTGEPEARVLADYAKQAISEEKSIREELQEMRALLKMILEKVMQK